MTTSLKIAKQVINRLLSADKPKTGKLYGTFYRNSLLVLGLQIHSHDDSPETDLSSAFPAEVDLCGILDIGDGICDKNQIRKCMSDVDITDNPVFLSCKLGKPNEILAYFIINDNIESANYTVIGEKDIYSEFLMIRIKSEIPFTSELSADSIRNAFTATRTVFTAGKMVFTLPKFNVYFLGSDFDNISLDGNPSISDLCDNAQELIEGSSRKKKSNNYEIDVLNSFIKKRTTVELSVTGPKCHGLVCILDKKQTKTLNIIIPIDALALVPRSAKVFRLYEILLETVIRNLKLFERSVLLNFKKHMDKPENMSLPEVFHFYPDECGHFVTRIYPKKESEESLLSNRLALHEKFLLSKDAPMFKRANKYLFEEDNEGVRALLNPHESILIPNNSGEVALVKGKYRYYHYCQDRTLDDNGWGCAYRSLQTLASWFVLQGYTDRPVPTFKDIQKCLVDIGDKPDSFLGSRQWIGSTEVSFVLSTLLDVTCRIVHASSGEELASYGPTLVDHFKKQGTPIMIGGGVLAHTIIGINYNNQTGEAKFLILDPHYTGDEDIQVILNKGWCGWKGVNFWDKGSYYNMCLPQVPIGI